jgi:hypothetical protein
VSPPSDDVGEEESTDPKGADPPSLFSVARQLEAVLAQQTMLNKRMMDNTAHVLKIHQSVDPLTWKRRALIMALSTFAGGFAGGSLTTLVIHQYEQGREILAPPAPTRAR